MTDDNSAGKATRKDRKRLRRRRLNLSIYLWLKKSERYLWPGVRALLGLLLIASGVLGFLPVLGFWMVPLGFGLLATDIPPLKRWVRGILQRQRKKRQPRRSSCRDEGPE